MIAAPQGVAAQMRSWAAEIEESLEALAIGDLRDINEGGHGVVFVTGTPFHWSELLSHLHPQQSRILEDYRRFAETLRVLLREQPEVRLQKFHDDGATVLGFVNRDPSSRSTAREVFGDTVAALRSQIGLIEGLGGELPIVPQTRLNGTRHCGDPARATIRSTLFQSGTRARVASNRSTPREVPTCL